MNGIDSRQVAFWEVHELIQPVLNQVNDWPALGTPAWCSLTDDDPRKWCALLDGAQQWALYLELRQEARADASKAIAAAADWTSVASDIQRRSGVYIPRAVDR